MAFVRVKRRLNEDPIDALVLSAKKVKTDSPQRAVFTFAATCQNKDDVQSQIRHVLNSSEYDPKKPRVSAEQLSQRLKRQKKYSQANRLKVVNCLRSIELDESVLSEPDDDDESSEPVRRKSRGRDQGVGSSVWTVVEVERSSINGVPTGSSSSASEPKSEEYVYDYYYSHNSNISDSTVTGMLSAYPVSSDILSEGSEWYQNESSEEEIIDDEDDSNDETNWRNDYPEEYDDDQSSIDEDDMRLAASMNKVKIGDDGEYSSDLSSEDEDLIYGGDVSVRDIQMYGTKYANYKARVVRDLYDDSDRDSSDSN